MNNKIKNIIISVMFFIIFITFFSVNILTHDNEISKSERRKLKQFPNLNWNNIFDTKFMDDFDKYVLDQFIFRDTFRQMKTYMEFNILKKKDNNDLFIEDGYIFKNLYPLSKNSVETTANKINSIYEMYLKDMNVYYTIIPDKNYYLNDNLGYLKLDYKKLVSIMNDKIKKIDYIDIFDTLSLESYYKTDIHYRQDKLYDMALKISNHMGVSIVNDYEKRVINDFRGSYFGQVAINNIATDDIVYLTNDMIKKATVYNHETNKYTPIYDLEKLESVDKYDIFLSGPTALLDIYNPNALSDKELIVFRDSFGSSFIPLIIRDYKKITVVDIRYLNSNHLNEFINFQNQDVLFMYSVNIINNGSILR